MLPNLLVIGGFKCGTTSLHTYLGAHPEIAMSEAKELNFLVRREDLPAGSWHRGVAWYESWFSEPAAVRGESSHHYTAYPLARGVPERAASLVPDAALIYLVRDPIERLISHYMAWLRTATAPQPLDRLVEDALAAPAESTLTCRSMYARQLERWLERFPQERLLVLDLDELHDRPAEVLARTFRFLGVDDSFSSPVFGESVNPSSEQGVPRPLARRAHGLLINRLVRARRERTRSVLPSTVARPLRAAWRRLALRPSERPVLAPELRGALGDVFAPDVERLRALTGQRFAGWSV